MSIIMPTGCDSGDHDKEANKPVTQYTMPTESAPHEGTWLQWPHKYQYGTTYRDRIEPTWIAMTRELVSGEKVHIIAYNEEVRQDIIAKLTSAGVPLNNVDFYIYKTNDVWVRDNGPIYVRNRNPRMTQSKAEALFTTYFGATHFIWLDGVPGLDITDMHIDGFARFGEQNQIITMSRKDLQHNLW